MTKTQIKPYRPVYPSPAALITSCAEDGRPNIISLGEVFNISIAKPVIVGIAIHPERYSHELITANREFVINLPTTALVSQIRACGSVSGRKVDKFATYGLTPLKASNVLPPLIAECPVNLECRVISIQEVGDHDLFLGEVLAEHVNSDLLDETGKIIVDRLDPLCYLHKQFWSIGEKLGEH